MQCSSHDRNDKTKKTKKGLPDLVKKLYEGYVRDPPLFCAREKREVLGVTGKQKRELPSLPSASGLAFTAVPRDRVT